MLEDYLVSNLRISYKWDSKIFKTSKLTLQVNNLLNNEYISNAWVYRFISDGWDPRGNDPLCKFQIVKEDTIWPPISQQATRNYLLGLTLGFLKS